MVCEKPNLENFSQCDAIVCDFDGTIYLDQTPINGAAAFLQRIVSSGRKLFYFTNNTSKSRQTYLEKLRAFGFPAEDEMLITATDCTIDYLKKNALFPEIYLIGNRDLTSEFLRAGFICLKSGQLDSIRPFALVLGFDTELTYEKIAAGYRLLTEHEIPYIATHADILCPVGEGRFIPDVGTFISLFATATGGKLPLVMGKPEKNAVEAICRRANLPPQRIAFVGDRLYTDMRMAKLNNMVGVLVLSGETNLQMAQSSPDRPEIIVPSVSDLIPAL